MLGRVDVISRITTYGFSVPSREVLFTVVSRQEKYKAKNVIDTIAIRGADWLASAAFSVFKTMADFPVICWLMLPAVGMWWIVAIKLGRIQSRLAEPQSAAS
jgi:AAA family ATP:ADP antiporter